MKYARKAQEEPTPPSALSLNFPGHHPIYTMAENYVAAARQHGVHRLYFDIDKDGKCEIYRILKESGRKPYEHPPVTATALLNALDDLSFLNPEIRVHYRVREGKQCWMVELNFKALVRRITIDDILEPT